VLPHRLPGGCELRLLEEADAEELFALVDGNRAYLSRWMPWTPHTAGPQHTLAFIRETRRQAAADNGFQAAIVRDGRIVGMAGFHAVDWEARSTSIGYWLAEEEQGAGTMTEAVRALVDHAFGAWGLARVEIRAAVENARSRAVAERLGFAEEGVRPDAEVVADRTVDHAVYGMTAAAWPEG